MARRREEKPSDRGLQRVAQTAGDLFLGQFLVRDLELLQAEGFLPGTHQPEGERRNGDGIQDGHLDRRILVHFPPAEELVVHVFDLQAEPFDHLLHQVGRGEGLDLIVDIGTGRIPAVPTGESGQVTHHRILGILIHDDLFRPVVTVGDLVEVDAGCGQENQQGKDIPPLVVPDKGPKVGELEGLLILGCIGDDKVVLLSVCHIA